MITLTESAKQQIIDLCKQHETDAVKLSVLGGGCAGFKYDWSFTTMDKVDDNDEVVDLSEGKFVIDSMSLPFIAGTEIDYVREVFGAHFEIKNPSATSSCGCGESFGA
jgi:iron-sulfur cluster insertion protein|tara:strand:+ start:273 stop:596 length:324 start_codon:yes stop_codon:yes gene_type:complete